MRVPSITEARTMETIVINLTCSYSDLSTMFHKDQRAYNTQIRATMVNRTERERERERGQRASLTLVHPRIIGLYTALFRVIHDCRARN